MDLTLSYRSFVEYQRKVRHSRLESRTSRLKLTIQPKPHTGPALADGVTLLYRRCSQKNGTWVLKARGRRRQGPELSDQANRRGG